ncbi:hypothetical protein J437_LFUL006038 [Ladona fulva]|uniref:DUF5641 domain-containing protein n=1 Tax=Ladona fulva TaxID=123851 RepID=A0A8K0K0Q7_LADFU|nr:hypothetical protein J437_LFUL006038 [Ladona fulva]
MLWSDKGTNVSGADKALRTARKSSISSRAIAKSLGTSGTEWRFNPSSAPHFGVIWEAAMKSIKYLLRRVFREDRLIFEELYTLLCQVEACLYSRPLTPLSDDPNDTKSLTSLHFLINGWKLIQQIFHHFWQRWSRVYLPSLQIRNKLTQPEADINVGDLVLLFSESAPARWPLARVAAADPGGDNHVHMETVRTADSVFQRPITKLVVLHPSSGSVDS